MGTVITKTPFTRAGRQGGKPTSPKNGGQEEPFAEPPPFLSRLFGHFSRETSKSNVRSLVLCGESEGLSRLIEKHKANPKKLDAIDAVLFGLSSSTKGHIVTQKEREIINVARAQIMGIREKGTR